MTGLGKKSYGWIKLNRSIQNSWLWEADRENPFSRGQAWIDLILSANHKENKMMFDGNLITIQKGEFITSEIKLSQRWGWSRSKTRKFLKNLENDQMIDRKMNNKGTVIRLLNYAVYQDIQTAEEQQKNNRETTEEQQKDINKNDKECYKNDKERDARARGGAAPTLSEIKKYISEKHLTVNAQKFFDHYEAVNWTGSGGKPINWKQKLRDWHNSEKNFQAKQGKADGHRPSYDLEGFEKMGYDIPDIDQEAEA